MATYYAYAASNGSWTWSSGNTTNWYSGSGGTGVNGTAPTTSDTVIFNSASGTGTVTWTSGVCLNLQCNSGYTGKISGTASESIPGSLTLVTGMTFNITATITFTSTSSGNTITTAGHSFANQLNFNGAGGVWTLQDTVTCNNTVTLSAGDLECNSQTINCTIFNSSNSATRTLTMTNSTINCSGTGTVWSMGTVTGLTLNASGSTINITDTSATSKTFSCGAVTVGAIVITGGASSGTVASSGSYTAASLSTTNPSTITMSSAPTIGTLEIAGTSSNQTSFKSNTAGVQRIVTLTNQSTCNYCTFEDIAFSGARVIATTGGVDSGDNFGINFPISPWTLVQVAARGTGTASATATFANAPTQGNLIVAWASSPSIVSPYYPTIADGNSNAFTSIVHTDVSTTIVGVSMYAYIAGSSQSTSVVATGFTSDTIYVNAIELHGNYAATNGTASTFLDNNVTGTYSSSTAVATTGNQSVTTTLANSLIISMFGTNSSFTAPIPTGQYGIDIFGSLQGNMFGAGAYVAIASGSSNNISFSWTTSNKPAMVWAAFAATGSSPSVTNHFLTLLGVGS